MITKNWLMLTHITVFSLVMIFITSCEEHNIHGDTLAKGIWAVKEVRGIDTTQLSEFTFLPASQISFNFCSESMNDDWRTDDERYGDCWMLIGTSIDHQFTQDEYRFHILSDEALEIMMLEEHSDKKLPDLTGTYTYNIDGRNMVMKYQGSDRLDLRNLEIHCWDWEP